MAQVAFVAEETIGAYLRRIVIKEAGLTAGKLAVLLDAQGTPRAKKTLYLNMVGHTVPTPATIRALADLPALQRAGFNYEEAMRLAGHIEGDVTGAAKVIEVEGELPPQVRELLALYDQMNPDDQDLWEAFGRELIRHRRRRKRDQEGGAPDAS